MIGLRSIFGPLGCAGLLGVAACAAPASAPPPPQQQQVAVVGDPVSGAELKAAFMGATMRGFNYYGSRLNIYVAPDGSGRLRRTTPSGKNSLAVGRLTVEGDLWCAAWSGDPETVCVKVLKNKDGYVNVIPPEASESRTTIKSVYTIVPGNPDQL